MPGMDPPPKQPEKKEESQGVLTAAQWLKDWLFVPQESSITSIGEFLLPVLFGTMESCWVAAILIGLASTGLFELSEPLIPLWAPFILIAGSILLFHYMGERAARKASSSQENDGTRAVIPGTALFFAVVAVLSLFFTWLHVYAQKAFVFDPKWLLALLNDILFLNMHFFEAISITGLSFLLGWRGIRLLNRHIEPSDVFRVLCVGLGVMIVVIILRTGQAREGAILHDDAVLLFLIPLFLFLSLAAHALARVVFIRHSHPTGLQGSIIAQERAILAVIGSLGLIFLFVALLVSSTINPSILQALAPLGAVIARVYGWLVEVIASIAVLIATPFFWLAYLFTRLFPPKALSFPRNQGQPGRPKLPSFNPGSAALIVPFVKIILPILLLLLVFALIWWALRRRRRVRISVQRQREDVHESLWSWSLFWKQFKAFLHMLFGRFFHRDKQAEDAVDAPEEIKGEPAARSIREIYRAFLKKAAGRGYSRKRFETPYEFKQRLDEKVPLAEPQLEVITQAYTLTRYGGDVPDEAQLELVRRKWAELDQKWV